MFPRRRTVAAERVFVKVLVSLFTGTFLFVCQPRMAGHFFVSKLPDRESKLLAVGHILDGVIASRSFKSADIHGELRLMAGKSWDYPGNQIVFLRAIGLGIVLYNAPTGGSFQIRSPPSPTLA